MKNRTTVEHGMLPDLESYLVRSGWTLEEPVGQYEVLRARRPGYPRPLLIHNRSTGVAVTALMTDLKVYAGWKKNRAQARPPVGGHYRRKEGILA